MAGSFNYVSYIQSDCWLARRHAYYATHARECVGCKSTDGVELHHLSYERVYAELDTDLMPLCQRCHSQVHQVQRMTGRPLPIVTLAVVSELRTPTRPVTPKKVFLAGKNEPNAKVFATARVRQRGETPHTPMNRAVSERLRRVARWKRANGIPS